MRTFVTLLAGALFAGHAGAQQCYSDLGAFVLDTGTPTTVENFEGFAADTRFDMGPLPIGVGTIEAIQATGFRNVVDVPPFSFTDNNGTRHASCFTDFDAVTEVHVELARRSSAFGCRVSGATDGEVLELVFRRDGIVPPIGICAVASNDIDQFVGWAQDISGLDSVIFRSSTMAAGFGEGFGLDDVRQLDYQDCYTSRAVYSSNCDEDASEPFEGFAVDTDLMGGVETNIGIVQTINPIGFRNFIDVAPFMFNDNNGTTHASCFTDADVGLGISILFPRRARCFGASLSRSLDNEMAELVYFDEGTPLQICAAATNAIDAFVGYRNEGGFTRVAIRSSAMLAGGEGFGLDDLTLDYEDSLGVDPGGCPPNATSTGDVATIRAVGSDVAADQDVTLIATGIPPGEFGYFIGSQTSGFVANPGGSNGNLCLSGNVGRYNRPGQIMSGPLILLDVGDINVPTNPAPGQPIQAGDTWYWQCWFRDFGAGGGSNNFTNLVEVEFH